MAQLAEVPERPVVEVEPSDERTGIGGGPRGIETDEQGGHGGTTYRVCITNELTPNCDFLATLLRGS
jgi:hypothetical protein